MEAPTRAVHIGRSLRAKREEKFLTQERLAEAARISQKQISQIERNEVEPRFSTILRLAEVLSVEPGDLVDKEED
jgi:transcriptional regulator with XRE-family HTH domain